MDVLWQVSLQTGAASKLHEVAGLTKVVGIDRDDADKILVLIKRGPTTAPSLLSLATGAITKISYDANSPNDRKLLNHLKGCGTSLWRHHGLSQSADARKRHRNSGVAGCLFKKR